MATKTMKIVRKLAGKNATIFNDKCVDGARSVKVWNWNAMEYRAAKMALENAGLQAVITKHVGFNIRSGGHYVQERLRVFE